MKSSPSPSTTSSMNEESARSRLRFSETWRRQLSDPLTMPPDPDDESRQLLNAFLAEVYGEFKRRRLP